MKEKTIADAMYRDPFRTPYEAPWVKGTDLERAFCALVPPERRKPGVLITTPADWPKTVIDATSDGVCEVCLQPVWLSPSSRRVAYPVNVVCLACLERAHDAAR